MERDLSKMYKDKKQESVNKLKDISAEYVHIEIGTMLIISTVFAAVILVVYIVKKGLKYRKLMGIK